MREYHITPDRDEWAAPEETLVDAGSSYANLEQPVGSGIFRTVGFAVAAVAVILSGAAFKLAVIDHAQLAASSARNRTVNVAVPPPRGIIMDRTGKVLVENVPSFDLLVIGRELETTATGDFSNSSAIAALLDMNAEDLVSSIGEEKTHNAVFFVAVDLSKDTVLALRSLLPAGMYITTSTKRSYIDGPQFSDIIGYVGKVSKQDLGSDRYYLPTDTVGRLGIEAAYEDVLRGEHGTIEFSSGGQDTEQSEPKQGNNLSLNIDAQMQKHLYNDMFSEMRGSGLSGAAGIIQDPRTGAVLSLVSLPGYDNNIFSSAVSKEQYSSLFESRGRPLFNRVIGGVYNPGSTIKPFIGMTALTEHVVTPDDSIQDCVSISIPNPGDPQQPYVYNNWRVEYGSFNMRRAIANSCNVYFFTVGGGFGSIKGLGAERIVNYLKKAFADSVLGIDLIGEDHGFLPTPEWKAATKGEPWYQGDTYNISIGQGDLSVTPLWINAYVSGIANGGTLWEPQVAGRVVDDQRQTIKAMEPVKIGTMPFSADVIGQMQRDMRETVITGTAKALQDVGAPVAAKTGTAEVVKGQRINSLLTLYAPADNPQIAMTVLFEGSVTNEGYAIRAARSFLNWYFHRSTSPTPDVSPAVSPAASVSPTPQASVL